MSSSADRTLTILLHTANKPVQPYYRILCPQDRVAYLRQKLIDAHQTPHLSFTYGECYLLDDCRLDHTVDMVIDVHLEQHAASTPLHPNKYLLLLPRRLQDPVDETYVHTQRHHTAVMYTFDDVKADLCVV